MLGCQTAGNPIYAAFHPVIAGLLSKTNMMTALNLACHTPYLSEFISTTDSKHLQILSFFFVKTSK